jgi:ABC-type Zn2+ transport system substrate-binding protein/surface adhesin
MSTRFSAPTLGLWLEAHKKDVVALTLTTTVEECQAALNNRQRYQRGKPGYGKHIEAQQHMFERVTALLTEKGFRVEYVSREEAPSIILGLL